MANVDTPKGLQPVRYLNGAPYNGQANLYYVPATDATAIFIGDVVSLAASGSDATGKYAAVTRGTVTSGVFVGVMVGVDPDLGGRGGRDAPVYREASQEAYVWVADDPMLVFEVQEVSGGTALVASSVGLNADLVSAAGSTTTGLSGIELNNVGEATTNTLDVQILNVSRHPDNALGEHCKFDVRINRHQYRNQIAGI